MSRGSGFSGGEFSRRGVMGGLLVGSAGSTVTAGPGAASETSEAPMSMDMAFQMVSNQTISNRRYFGGEGLRAFFVSQPKLADVRVRDARIESRSGIAFHINHPQVNNISLIGAEIVGATYGILTNAEAAGSRNISILSSYVFGGTSDALEWNHPNSDVDDFKCIGSTLETGTRATQRTSGFAAGVAGVRSWVLGFNHISVSRLDAIHVEDSQRRGLIIGNTAADCRAHGLNILAAPQPPRRVTALTWGGGVARAKLARPADGGAEEVVSIAGAGRAGWNGLHNATLVDALTMTFPLADPGEGSASAQRAITASSNPSEAPLVIGNSFTSTSGRRAGAGLNVVTDANGAVNNTIFVGNSVRGFAEGLRTGGAAFTFAHGNLFESCDHGLVAPRQSRVIGTNLASNVRVLVRAGPGAVVDKQIFVTEPDVLLERGGAGAPGPILKGFAGSLTKTRDHAGDGLRAIPLFWLPARLNGRFMVQCRLQPTTGVIFEAQIWWDGVMLRVEPGVIEIFGKCSDPGLRNEHGQLCLSLNAATGPCTFVPYIDFDGLFLLG